MKEKAVVWNEKRVYLAAVIIITIGLLAALTTVAINLNNSTAMLSAAVLNTRSDWAVTHTFSFSATGLTSGGKTIDISGGGKFVAMADAYYNVWLKGRGTLVSVNDGKRVAWKAPQTGLYNQLEGNLTFTASATGQISWITGPVEIDLTQGNDPNDPSTGKVKVTIGTEVFEGPAIVVIS